MTPSLPAHQVVQDSMVRLKNEEALHIYILTLFHLCSASGQLLFSPSIVPSGLRLCASDQLSRGVYQKQNTRRGEFS